MDLTHLDTFAVFVLVNIKDDLYAGTTRPSDINDTNTIGLPGGKVDKGETLIEAAYRECKEEGWSIKSIDETPINIDIVDGKKVVWFRGYEATKLSKYKESNRLIPIEVTLEEISNSGYGNEFVKNI